VSEREHTLDSKYLLEEGTILLSGVQALVRLPLDQHRADRRAGLRTATLISGYRGSPLGGFDFALEKARRILEEHDVRFLPGVNEDLAATAVFGSQIAGLFPGAKYDGVLGMWYGKSPGVDCSGDAFKHANFAGVSRTGGVLAVAGDDATAKSSTLPSQSEAAFYDALMPILSPGNVQEVLDLGRYGFALSRISGLWVGFKIATEVADAFSTAEVSPARVSPIDPELELDGKPFRATQKLLLVGPWSLDVEREIYRGRLEAAKAFSRANRLNRVRVSSSHDRIGIAAPGKTYFDLREALSFLGLDDDALRRFGIRLFQIRMPFPFEPETALELARGLEEILVLEEKRPFVELFLKDALYHERDRPRIVGKSLVPADGALDADGVASIVAKWLAPYVPASKLDSRLGVVGFLRETMEEPLPLSRLFHFCSGCPHSRSTTVPEGSIASAGIGCHGMALTMDRSTTGITHMGGEGVQWVGMSPFTETPHIFQNLGDGTLFHSGTLAIRQAVASGVNVTFKILYNGAVAMTGGQKVDGGLSIGDLTRELEAEGVRKVLVVSDQPRSSDVWPRERLDEAQRLLREIPGTTALIYEQECAAELRRKRRRGLAPKPERRVFINEAVCEGCGDCGVKSSCMSLHPVTTEFGRKTRVHQSSCNQDFSCLEGDCPSFVEVIPGKKPPTPRIEEVDLPRPENRKREASIYMVGIGGTGVVTANQILATAAALEGKSVLSLDQTGLSQKGGPVVSHLKILSETREASGQIAAGEADVYLGFDVLTAAQSQHLTRARPDRTAAVVSTSAIPTGHMVSHVEESFPDVAALRVRIDNHTRARDNLYFDAVAVSERFFSDHMPANTVVLGAAYQKGLLPLSKWSIEKAIEINGAFVETNRRAFYLGRRIAADPEFFAPAPPVREASFERLVAELTAYQNEAYAQAYSDFIVRVRAREREAVGNGTELSDAVARGLFKLMAYKDEYEVARLSTRADLERELAREFGEKTEYRFLFHPPLLRALGLKRKLALGAWSRPFLRALAKMNFLRGTPLDPFGYARMRREERALIGEYRSLVERQIEKLTPENYDAAVEVAGLADLVRGYEEVKLRNVERFRRLVSRMEAR